jgi:exodeoxyribonuclease VII large subunit
MSLPLFPSEPSGPRRVSLVKLSAEIARSIATVGKVVVEGEVHRPTRSGRGAIYFTLKDRAAQISVVCPSNRASRCRAVAGERVAATGPVTWSAERGQLSLVAEEVVPVGDGAIAAAIADARRRLEFDGLLDPRRRRRIPRLPAVIGVVCGNEAAVRADIESVVAARFPAYPVEFLEVTVSGSGAVDSVITAISMLDARPEVEVIVLARGGGDATQLLPFSDEALCRAVAQSGTPVVSAIGHDGDRPLCDEVADLRCGTPSLAAGAVVPDRALLEAELASMAARVDDAFSRRVELSGLRLASVDRERALEQGMAVAHARLARPQTRLELLHPGRRLAEAVARLAATQRHVESLAPTRVLERGYAVVRIAGSGQVVREAGQVSAGVGLDVQLSAGSVAARVEEVRADGS